MTINSLWTYSCCKPRSSRAFLSNGEFGRINLLKFPLSTTVFDLGIKLRRTKRSSFDIEDQKYVYRGCRGILRLFEMINAASAESCESKGFFTSFSRSDLWMFASSESLSKSRVPNKSTVPFSNSFIHHSSQYPGGTNICARLTNS